MERASTDFHIASGECLIDASQYLDVKLVRP
jgi:hypothetical protein